MLFFDQSKQKHPLNVINDSSLSSRDVGPVYVVNTKKTPIIATWGKCPYSIRMKWS
jgi:hypothetical protein